MTAPAQARDNVRRRLTWALAIAFMLTGMYIAGTHRFERWAGKALEQTAPVARRVIPAPAKRILRESQEHLPVYGSATTWLARKTASIVYFGIVGVFVLALRKERAASLGQMLAVTVVAAVAMSALIEFFEAPEEIADVLLDLGLGAVGGLIAGLAAWWWQRR